MSSQRWPRKASTSGRGRGQNRRGSPICFNWRDNGYCKFGDQCKYPHPPKKNPPNQLQSWSRSSNANRQDDTLRFIKLLASLTPNRLDAQLDSSADKWRRSWDYAGSKSFSDAARLKDLVECLAKIPPSSSVEPPPITSCLKVVQNLCGIVQRDENPVSRVTTVEVIQNAVSRMLGFEWDCDKEVVQGSITEILLSADACLKKSIKEHRVVSAKLMKSIEDVEKPWRVRVKSSAAVMRFRGSVAGDSEIVTDGLCYDDWRKATVDWLSTPDFFTPALLPKMKIPSSNDGGVYASSDEYMEIVTKNWVAMTFCDGFAALSPQCQYRTKSGNACQQALWPVSNTQAIGSARCRTRNCKGLVKFACRMRGHDTLCGHCMIQARINNRGSPGRKASTHVYDGRVDHVNDSDGRLYISSFESRNPPQHEIHWRSTKRLSSPNLVGIVKVQSTGAPLRGSDEIHWGEIVFHRNPRDEDKMRKSGKVAINMMAVTDFDFERFKADESIAIIDCMSFCPEWVPVLKALEQQKLESLPFHDGQYLNLCRDEEMHVTDPWLNQVDSMSLSDIHRLVDQMIASSTLDPIVEIRRDSTICASLQSKLSSLIVKATLDRMQLISFLGSLCNPIHLTQGPPGTGKSYLGVVLVRALIILRDHWIRKNRSIGSPPILVLSYKNHAIDEFLCDLIQAETPFKLRNKLVRIGGQCNDTRLQPFSERYISRSDKQVQSARNRLEMLHNMRNFLDQILEDSSEFLAYKLEMFEFDEALSEDERIQRRNKAAYEATDVLLNTLARVILLEESKDEDGLYPIDDLRFLAISKDDKLSCFALCGDEKMLNSVPLLRDGVSHYSGMNQVGDVLYEWIRGQVPLPCCQFKSCKTLASSPDLPFCLQHRCRYSEHDGGDQCLRSVTSDGLKFCTVHMCKVDECPRSKFGDGHDFCKVHVCRRCIELNCVPTGLATDDPPRNVCEIHPLCLVPECLTYCSDGVAYCEEHTVTKCKATTKRGRACTRRALSRTRPYCLDHIKWMAFLPSEDRYGDDSSDDSSIEEVKLCAALTNKKKPCKGNAMPGCSYCYNHAPMMGVSSAYSKLQVQNVGQSTFASPNANTPSPRSVSPLRSDEQLHESDNLNDNAQISTCANNEESPDKKSEHLNETSDLEVEADDFFSVGSEEALIDRADCAVADNIDEIDLEPEAENLQHLLDVFEICSESSRDEDSVDVELSAQNEKSIVLEEMDVGGEQHLSVVEPSEWDWSMDLTRRWDACLSLIKTQALYIRDIKPKLMESIVDARKKLHQTKVRASAKVYENRSIIGGTMVGCISRLEAIRSCKPFAVVVEEASEVLEPLLFSCLCSSTVKLEMIGDHLQLQPSVMSRYEFELVNKINISMFQRLIQAPPGFEVPSAVLSVQRRMRSNICDLTREYYSEITTIEDHDKTVNQTIGQRDYKGNDSALKLIQASLSMGREVPGISPHIFLWTHKGTQERSRVGLSRINPGEADMVVAMASYLVDCGVPKSSIVILTPYKGQLMHLRGLMLGDKYRAKKLISRTPSDKDCRLSTVDRFQGDESDIVLISLVVDKNSRTPFVKLQNRMIVLLSRARLGMYIFGNLSYFEENETPEHWNKTFRLLQEPSKIDSDTSASTNYSIFGDARVGESIQLCCPVHRSRTMEASSAKQLQLKFCDEACQEELPCGHACLLPCHWPKLQHNQSCGVKLQSPCAKHPDMISCSKVYSNAPGISKNMPWDQALKAFKCPIRMSVSLPCHHSKEMRCWEESAIANGTTQWPSCHEQSQTPYLYPNCKHTIDVTCERLDQYTNDPSSVPLCREMVPFVPMCGHGRDIMCSSYDDYISGSKVFCCPEQVEVSLPRCGHDAKLSCPEAAALNSWNGDACTEVGRIFEGVSYGPRDYVCHQKVRFARPCGHETEEDCGKAFEMAKVPVPCPFTVEAINRFCGHRCKMKCGEEKQISDLPIPPPVTEWREGEVPPMISSMMYIRCKKIVSMRKTCGHVMQIKCHKVTSVLPVCNEKVIAKSPLCGHEVEVCCNLQTFSGWKGWNSDQELDLICSSGVIPRGSVLSSDVDQLPDDCKKAIHSCEKTRIFVKPCGHKIEIPCKDLLDVLSGSSTMKCNEMKVTRLTCGHDIEVPCWKLDEYNDGKVTITCTDLCCKPCWNFDSCGRTLECQCGESSALACAGTSVWTCESKLHKYTMKQCVRGRPIECPGCSFNLLSSMVENENFDICTDLPQCFSNMSRDKIFDCPIDQNIENFQDSVSSLFAELHEFLKEQDIWDRQLFKPKAVPCFVVPKTKSTANLTSFDPQRLARKEDLFGISVFELNATNCLELQKKIKGENETILVGIGVCARTAIEKSLPKRKGKEKKRKELQRDFFTSMSYLDRGAKKIIFFEPFSLLATHRIIVTKEDLNGISQQLTGKPAIDLTPSRVSYISPPGKVKACQVKRTSRDSFDENSANEDTIDTEVIVLLSGSPFESTTFTKWSAGTIGSNGVLSVAIEEDLLAKMKFTNATAKPFAGKRLLENLLQTNDSPFLFLLLSLEICEFDRTNGLKYLMDYVSSTKVGRQPVHPWSLIAYARLHEKVAKPLLRAFSLLYPEVFDRCLSQEELELVDEAEDEDVDNVAAQKVSLELKWNKLKESYPNDTQSEAMEKLLKLTGLKKVKEAALKIYSSALQLARMNPETRKRNIMAANYCFLGNPGTGKTTVARLFAEVLYDAGLRKKRKIVETTAQQAKDGGMDEFRKLVSKAKDGVLFIDEAYDLDPVGDFKGKPIVNELLTLTENSRDSISVILAGYEDDFNAKLFSYNDGLKSRLESILFEDFDESELTTIWDGMREEKCWKENSGVCRVAVSRLVKLSGRKGFGNAREVRKVMEKSIQSAMVRLGEELDESTMVLDIVDVIGEDPRHSKKLEALLTEIDGKIGWKRIKEKIWELINLCGANRDRELKGEPQHDIFLNRMFLGNPGTGKTTCAKLYGRLLKHLGFLSIGDVVVKTSGDFVGSFVGESQKKTIAIIEGARGKVLLIDEAYNLDDKMYGKQVLDTLVEKVQNTSSDDIAVVLIGYEEPMLNMIRNQNPGLARRFPKDYAFYFDDYDENELLKIMQSYLKRNKVTASVEFLQCAMEILESQRRQANFGNAGSIELLMKGAIQKSSLRGTDSGGSTQLKDCDLDRLGSARASAEGDPLELLDKLYRMGEVKSKIEKLRDYFLVAKREGGNIPSLGHFVFMGNPGTGKTTVARVMAEVLYSLELIPSNIIQETTGLDLTGDFVGQTKTKVNEILRQAKGGVLFIDEAYNLAFGPYGKEACDTIVAAMTSEEFKDVVIIIAGYAADIDKMLHSNAGLKSRFNHYMEFPDWDANDCANFFMKKAEAENFIASGDVKNLLYSGFTDLLRLDGWGNGRDVVALWKDSLNERASRVVKSPEPEKSIQSQDISSALTEMIKARKPKTGLSLAGRGVSLNMPVDQRSADPPDSPIIQTTTQTDIAEEDIQQQDVPEERESVDVENLRDDGVSDEVWAELEDAKAKEALLRAQCEEFERIQKEKEQAEIQARIDYEQKLEKLKLELEAKERAEALRKAHEAEERRKKSERLAKLRREMEEQKRREMIRQAERIKAKLRQISPCPAGFNWHKCGGGWRCGGGSHFVSDAQLNAQFTFEF